MSRIPQIVQDQVQSNKSCMIIVSKQNNMKLSDQAVTLDWYDLERHWLIPVLIIIPEKF